MTPVLAVAYSFLFGLLHGILPDEHTWPITFSYAIGGASGRAGMRASLYFSAAFTVQRMIVSELAYLALAPFLLSPTINGIVYVAVGVAMSIAGAIVLKQNRYPHLHLLGHHHDEVRAMETSGRALGRHHADSAVAAAPPARWTVVHGFLAGFGFGGFSVFVNTVAAPAMASGWVAFLPGLAFGVGTTITLVAIGAVVGASLHWTHALTREEIQQIGGETGGRTLFFGGLLFALAGVSGLLGFDRYLPADPGSLLIAAFVALVAIPAFAYSLRRVLAARKQGEAL